jgi:beta-lactamase regulating signal transducer with metallopeptidase domain/Tol biopolymer transport system component
MPAVCASAAVPLWDTGVKATVLLVAAFLVTALLRRASAAVRHRVWCLAFAGLLLLPTLSSVLPGWPLSILPQLRDASPVADHVVVKTANRATDPAGSPWGRRDWNEPAGDISPALPGGASSGAPQVHSERQQAPAPSVVPFGQTTSRISLHTLIGVLWLLGAGVTMLPIVAGLVRSRSLRRSARPVVDAEPIRLLRELAHSLGVRRAIRLLETDESLVPMTWGLVRPTLVLPSTWRDWSPQQRRSVLLHELAHVSRCDVAFQLAARVACALYWFHPLAWYALRQLRIEREVACDDCVLMAGERPSDYAQQLVEIARSHRVLAIPATVAMARSRRLERRVRAVLDRARSHFPLSRRGERLLLICAALVVTGLAAMQPEARSEPQDEATTPVAEASPSGDERAEEPAEPEPPPAPVAQQARDHEPAKGRSSDEVSEAVDQTIRVFRTRGEQPDVETQRLGLYAIDVLEGQVTPIAEDPIGDAGYFGSPSWSADGRRILFDATRGQTWDKTQMKVFSSGEKHGGLRDLGPGNCPNLSPDGQRIAFLLYPGAVLGSQSGVWIWRIDSPEQTRRHMGVFGIPKWSPDGHQLLIVSLSSPCRLTLMDVETREQRPVELDGHRFYSSPGWAGDERTLVALVDSAGGARIALVDVTDPQKAQVTQVLWKRRDGLAVDPAYPVYSAKTERCVFVGENENGAALYTVRAGQSDPPKRLEPSGYDGKIASLAFSPDGRFVLFCSDRLKRTLGEKPPGQLDGGVGR